MLPRSKVPDKRPEAKSQLVDHRRESVFKNMTPEQLRSHCNYLLQKKYEEGDTVSLRDFQFLMFVLEKHPKVAEKVGVGVSRILVDKNEVYNSRCFYAIRIDGSKEHFSYLKCLGLKTHNTKGCN